MKRALLLFISAALFAGLSACSPDVKNNPSENETQVALLIKQASDDVTSQRFDAAMEKALRALDLAGGDPLLKVQALESIIGVAIMARLMGLKERMYCALAAWTSSPRALASSI